MAKIYPTGYVPKPGHAWNPLLKFPRNNPCPCGSGKKFKKCCVNNVPVTLPEKDAAHLRAGGQFRVVTDDKQV